MYDDALKNAADPILKKEFGSESSSALAQSKTWH